METGDAAIVHDEGLDDALETGNDAHDEDGGDTVTNSQVEEDPREAELKRLRQELVAKDAEIARLKDESAAKDVTIHKQREKAKKHRDKISYMTRALERSRQSRNALKKNPGKPAVRRALLKMHPRAKTSFMLGQTKRPGNWTREEIIQGLVLRNISKRAYKFIRKTKMMALPGLSTLRRWIRHFKVEPGLLHKSLELLGKSLQSQDSELYKLVCLSFDEMACDQDLSYDQREDRVLPSAKKFHISMIRGLCHNFKEHVWCGFDKDMKADTIEEIIRAVEQQGFRVVAAVSDFATTNQGLWNGLGVTIDHPFFKNPCDSERDVHVFADIPHMLKLFRNHFIDYGFILPSGTEFKREDLEELLSVDTTENELRLHPKFNAALFSMSKSARQRVRPAAQLFSNKTANLLAAARPEKQELVDVIKVVNSFFDVMNSRIPVDESNDLKSGYGKHLEQQDAILQRMFDMVTKMRQIGTKPKAKLKPFQEGIARSINSIRNLFKSLKKDYNISYLLTSHVNQDCVENAFSRIRGIGGTHVTPNPTECLNRLRLLMIGSKVLQNLVVDNTAVETADDESEEELYDGGVLLSAELHADLQPNNDEAEWEDIPDDIDQVEIAAQEVDEPLGTENDYLEDAQALIDDGEWSDIDEPDDGEPDLSLAPEECKEEAFKFVCGWLAYACQDKHPDLGVPTGRTPESMLADYPWLARISRGGLRVPYPWFLDLVREWERDFNDFHGGRHKISAEKGVITTHLQRIRALHPNSGLETVMRKFSTFRLHVRMKYLNALRREAAKEQKEARRNALKARQHLDLPSRQ